MFTPNQPPIQAPPQMLGNLQANYTFRLSQFINQDQITIVEDLPRNRPVREARKTAKTGKPYTVYLIRINSNGFEADLELFAGELNQIAIACPKGIENFKGITLVHNGRMFIYLSTAYPLDPSVPPRSDPRQPDLNPPASTQAPVDQAKAMLEKLVYDMNYLKEVNSPEYQITAKVIMNIAESINRGHALELITAAKAQGYIYENAGIYKVA